MNKIQNAGSYTGKSQKKEAAQIDQLNKNTDNNKALTTNTNTRKKNIQPIQNKYLGNNIDIKA